MPNMITAIRLQKKNRRRANLYLDGQFAMGLSVEVVQDFGLRRGQELDEAQLEALQRAEQQRRAYHDALRLISYRPRSVAEIRRRLERKGYSEAQIEAAVDRLQEIDLLDDQAFARLWVENRLALRPRGRRALYSELRKKGVSSTIIEQVLDDMITAEGEADRALALARKRARALAGLEREVFARRLQGYLARRGYPAHLVWPTVNQVWEEVTGEDE